jgi:ribosomal protein L22
MSPSKPSNPSRGKPDDVAKVEQDAAEAKAAALEDEAPDAAAEAEAVPDTPKPKRARRKTAAAKADEPASAGADKPAAPAAEPKAKPRRGVRRAKPEPEKPAARAKRPSRDYGDNPPMVRAHAKYVRTSARKARLVCDHIRGKDVTEARAILAHASRDVARDWSKLLESAVANAEHNHELIGDELRIAAVKADEGPTLKRFRPRAMGRATKIRKRTSHLSITLTPKDGDR